MCFYFIKSFRGAFNEAVSKLKIEPEERFNLRKSFSDFMEFESLFSEKIISIVFVSYDYKFYVNASGYAEIANFVFDKYGFHIEPVYKTIDVDCLSIDNYCSFEHLRIQVNALLNTSEAVLKKQQLLEFQQQQNRLQKELTKNLSKPLPDSLNGVHLMSLDFEYDQNKNYAIFECGVTKSINGTVQYDHYLVDEHYKSKKNYELQLQFQFGESKVVSMQELMIILKQSLANVDYLVGHCLLSEYLILKHYGLDIFNEFEQLQCLDTQKIFQEKFKSGLVHSNLSLSSLLELFDIEFEHLHNAGNDAAYTMTVLIKMAQAFYFEIQRNPERRRRISLVNKLSKINKMKEIINE